MAERPLKMTFTVNNIDVDDPTYKGRTWDQVEKALNDRETYIRSMEGLADKEARGPSTTNPCRNVIPTFPWEEKVKPFEKPASCTLKDWKHACLKYTVGRQCATLQLAKPEGNNSFDPAMIDALQDAIMDLQNQRSVRVVIVKSEGKFFSNGFDPKYLMSESSMTDAQITAIHKQFAKCLYFLSRLPQFTVALVQGSAMGAAVGLVCACDTVVSVRGAYYAMSETKLGAVPTVSIPYITRRITFIKNVYQLVLAGASLSAETAQTYGIVNEVVEDESGLEAESKVICERLTLCAPGAVAATKEVVLNTVGLPPTSFMLNYVADIVAEVRKGPESKSGVQAIQSREKPAWVKASVVP